MPSLEYDPETGGLREIGTKKSLDEMLSKAFGPRKRGPHGIKVPASTPKPLIEREGGKNEPPKPMQEVQSDVGKDVTKKYKTVELQDAAGNKVGEIPIDSPGVKIFGYKDDGQPFMQTTQPASAAPMSVVSPSSIQHEQAVQSYKGPRLSGDMQRYLASFSGPQGESLRRIAAQPDFRRRVGLDEGAFMTNLRAAAGGDPSFLRAMLGPQLVPEKVDSDYLKRVASEMMSSKDPKIAAEGRKLASQIAQFETKMQSTEIAREDKQQHDITMAEKRGEIQQGLLDRRAEIQKSIETQREENRRLRIEFAHEINSFDEKMKQFENWISSEDNPESITPEVVDQWMFDLNLLPRDESKRSSLRGSLLRRAISVAKKNAFEAQQDQAKMDRATKLLEFDVDAANRDKVRFAYKVYRDIQDDVMKRELRMPAIGPSTIMRLILDSFKSLSNTKMREPTPDELKEVVQQQLEMVNDEAWKKYMSPEAQAILGQGASDSEDISRLAAESMRGFATFYLKSQLGREPTKDEVDKFLQDDANIITLDKEMLKRLSGGK